MSKQKIPPPERSSEIQGEGNYTAAKEYDNATRNFVKSGKVDKAAQDAKPKNPQEEREMLDAEEKGRSRGKPESKAVHIPEPNTGTDNPGRNTGHGR